MNFRFLLPGLWLLWTAPAFSQQSAVSCGTSAQDLKIIGQRLLANRAEAGGVGDRAIQYVPVHFHLTADSEGKGRIKEVRILEQLCDLNEEFAPLDIRFFLNPHPIYGLFSKSISNDNVYATQTAFTLMNNRRHQNAINMFVVENADPNTPIAAAAYYTPQFDWIVIAKGYISGSGNGTLAHETGHFFSLPHPFNGYDFDSFDPTDAGWPIAPVISPLDVPTERQNGSNCATAGDFICDTPADYNFSNSSCSAYNGGAKDPTGVLVNPMEENTMGYFFNCDDYVFTPDQMAAMLADRATVSRAYLNNTFSPAATTVTSPSNLLIGPLGGDTTAFYDEVLLQWRSVAGATHFLVDVDVNNTFTSPLSQSFVVQDTSLFLTNLQANRAYSWRVLPFNQYYTCAQSRQGGFRTALSSSVADPSGEVRWEIIPNPLTSDGPVNIQFELLEQMEGRVSVWDVAGRQLLSPLTFRAGKGLSQIDLPLGNLPNGLYTVVLETASGRIARKLVVQR